VLAPMMGTAGIMLATSIMYLLSYVCYVMAALRRPPAKPAAASTAETDDATGERA
jgi:putative peptidoglycan lipid II flippase